MSDPYDDFMNMRRFEMRMMFGISSPNSYIKLPTEDLPEPLQKSAEQMNYLGTEDERKAAAKEFLALSEEWVDPA